MARNDNDEDLDDLDDDQDEPLDEGGGFLDSIQETFGAAPWWVISTVIHLVALALLTLLIFTLEAQPNDQLLITTDLAKKEKPEKQKDRDVFKSERNIPVDLNVENPLIANEPTEITDHIETENEMDMQTARGHEEAISDVPMGGVGVIGTIGVGGGRGGAFGHRFGGGRRKATGKYGGSRDSESAVDAALKWLARHQEADGRWDGEKYEGINTDAGITGLAVLAFLGAGHTEKTGIFSKNVKKGVAWLISQQGNDGAIGRAFAKGLGYHHSISGLALAESYGMAKVKRTGRAAQKAIKYSLDTHQVEYSAWRYKAKEAADLSVTGWFVMQLKSGKVAGLTVAGSGFQGAVNFLDKVTDNKEYGGRCSYQPGRPPSHTMTAVGMLCRQFMGWKLNDPVVQGGAQSLMEALPRWGDGNSGVNFYYWYYGTLVMFQMGGDYWKAWNNAMRDMLIRNQRKGGDEDGSWDPVGTWSARGGRVYSTAMGALCLEVYYRYLPIYK